MSLPRVVPTGGRILDGAFVPETTIVSRQAYSMQRQNTNVIPSPEIFNPHRWLEPDGDAERNDTCLLSLMEAEDVSANSELMFRLI
jgi:hypothetical protein